MYVDFKVTNLAVFYLLGKADKFIVTYYVNNAHEKENRKEVFKL